MKETLVGVAVGVFVGAFAMEVLNRKKPKLTRKIENNTKNAVNGMVAAFKEGWEGKDRQAKPAKAAEA